MAYDWERKKKKQCKTYGMKGTRADDRDIVIDNKNFSRCQEGERKRKARNKTSFCSAKKIMQSTNREKSHVRE